MNYMAAGALHDRAPSCCKRKDGIPMNKKAELFQDYLKEKQIAAFTVDEIKDDALNTVVFRSHIDVGGNQLPTLVILDSSIYCMIRLLVAPKALRDDNKEAVLELMNGYNKKYKSFKYYADDEGNLVMDTCVLFKDGEADGDMIYTMFNVIINHLNESYKDTMKAIWQ